MSTRRQARRCRLTVRIADSWLCFPSFPGTALPFPDHAGRCFRVAPICYNCVIVPVLLRWPAIPANGPRRVEAGTPLRYYSSAVKGFPPSRTEPVVCLRARHLSFLTASMTETLQTLKTARRYRGCHRMRARGRPPHARHARSASSRAGTFRRRETGSSAT